MSELINDAEKAVSAVASVTATPGVLERYGVMAIATLSACAISFGTGYLYRAHVDAVKQAASTAVAKTADKVASAAIATADNKTDAALQKRLNAAQSRAAALQQQINEARNANPPAADCRLPDGLRDALGAELAGHSGQVQGALQ